MHISTVKHIAQLVKAARKHTKLTQAELAAAAGLGVRFIRDLEQAKPTCQIEKTLLVIRMLGIKLIAKAPPDETT